MLARKFSSEGIRRWPRPWRERKTTSHSPSLPRKNGSEGRPNGVVSSSCSTAVSPFIWQNPLPPLTPSTVLRTTCAPSPSAGVTLCVQLTAGGRDILAPALADCSGQVPLPKDRLKALDRRARRRRKRRVRKGIEE